MHEPQVPEQVARHWIGERLIVVAQPVVAGRVPRWGVVYRDIADGLAPDVRFRWYVWLDGDDHATGPYEDAELV